MSPSHPFGECGERSFFVLEHKAAPAGLTWLLMLLLVSCVFLDSGCCHNMSRPPSSAPQRDINAVLADHDKELMAISGVVGVYVGLLSDQKTACLKVMLARKDSKLERRIPRELEGYPVVTEVTGKIRPMN